MFADELRGFHQRHSDLSTRLDAEEITPRAFLGFMRRLADDIVDCILHYRRWAEFWTLASVARDASREYDWPALMVMLLDRLSEIVWLKELPYDEYLRSDHWTNLAHQTKERMDGRCALDEDHAAEHAHHRTYARRGRERLADLVPLCGGCHAKFHGKTPR
jgi:hypothetical protein